MGELILCKEPLAGIPYYFEDMSLNVYSLEEVSYYIQKQAYLLDANFANYDLCQWIKRELGLKELGQELEDDLEAHEPLHVFVRHLLQANGYLTRQEIQDTVEIVAGYENKSEAEVKKIRADRLMESGRIIDAIYAYEGIIDKKIKMTSQVEAGVYHNLACAYGKLFFFQRAGEYFEKAYRLNRQPHSLSCMLMMYLLDDDEASFLDMVHRYQVFPEQVEQIRESVSQTNQDLHFLEFKEALTHIKDDYDNHEEYRKHLRGIVKRWETDYHQQSKY